MNLRANVLLEFASEVNIDLSEVVAIDYGDVEGLIVEELRQLVDVVIELENQDSKGLQVDFEVEHWHDDGRVVLIICSLPVSENLLIGHWVSLWIYLLLELEL